MPVPKWLRAEQTTLSTGTGTLTIVSGDASRRQMDATMVGAQPVLYVVHFPGTTEWETGIGTFDDASPGTLTRADGNVLSGSAGAGARVNLGPGTKNVFLLGWPGAREIFAFSTSLTMALADLGGFLVFSGATARTLSLPAGAGLPRGIGTHVTNASTALLTIDPAGAETINGAATAFLLPGEACEFFWDGAAWHASGLGTGLSLVERRSVTGTPAVMDFALPVAGADYEVHFKNVNFSADAQFLLRISSNSGASYDQGASDYSRTAAWNQNGTWVAGNNQGDALFLTDSAAAGSWKSGRFDFNPGSASVHPRITGGASTFAMPSAGPLVHGVFGGGRAATVAATNIRFLPSTGTFTAGTFAVYLRR